jgi:hypothetical protein
LKESCANCHYNGEGQRCSFRPGKSNFLIMFHFRVGFRLETRKSPENRPKTNRKLKIRSETSNSG